MEWFEEKAIEHICKDCYYASDTNDAPEFIDESMTSETIDGAISNYILKNKEKITEENITLHIFNYHFDNEASVKYEGKFHIHIDDELNWEIEEDDSQLFSENVIINKKDLYVNVDKFENGEKNVLLITGFSGSGKSTLAQSLASKYKCEHFELDCLDFYISNKMDIEKVKKFEPGLYSFINKKNLKQEKPNEKYALELYREYIKFLISWCKKQNGKFIIEGLQIYESYEEGDTYITSNPFIIKGTSGLISSIRGAKRNDGHFLKEFKPLMSWTIKDNKSLEKLRDQLMKESTYDWSYILEFYKDYENSSAEEYILEKDEYLMKDELFTEAGKSAILRDAIYPHIENTFKGNPTNVRKFNQLISNFINRNIDKLTTSGPVYLIPFTDNDKNNYYELFGIAEKDIKRLMKEHTAKLNSSKFKLLTQNPIFTLFYFVIRYFTLHPDKKSLNSALTIYALSAYPSIFTKYFPHGVIEPVMRYTIDNLTDKFLIKKTKHILGLLVESIQHSYQFLKSYMREANDDEVVRFIQRIRNDHNSMFKKIANIYMENHKKGYAISTTNTQYDDDTPIVDEVDNATTEVQNAVLKVTLPIVQNGVDIVRAEASAKMAGIGISDCRTFLMNIITDKNTELLQKFIESLLFLYLYEDKRTVRDIRSQYFLAWSVSLFKKTNSKNKNILKINEILNIWAEESGIYAKFHREASRINYKKSIFFYIILSIQKYIA